MFTVPTYRTLAVTISVLKLTLAGTRHFAILHGTGMAKPPDGETQGWRNRDGVGTTPWRFETNVVKLREKNERVGRDDRKRMVYFFKVLGQQLTCEVRSLT